MESEIVEQVQKWYVNQKPISVKDYLENRGVPNSEEAKWHWVWVLPDGTVVVTIWAVYIRADGNQPWEVNEELHPDLQLLNSNTKDHAEERIRVLKMLYEEKKDFIAIIQKDKPNKVDPSKWNAYDRVRDGHKWRVAELIDSGNGSLDAVLRRETWEEVSSTEKSKPANREMEGESTGPDNHLNFPSPEQRKEVEKAAIQHAKKEYERLHGPYNDVQKLNRGWDLEVTDQKTGSVLLVEVKGTAGEDEVFYLTRNEFKASCDYPDQWKLAIVTCATTAPRMTEYAAGELGRFFELDPLVWHCHPKRSVK